jgi:hypothetical protein
VRLAVTTAAWLLALALAGGAAAAGIGANDDTGKFADDNGTLFFSQMADLGLKQSVMTVRFLPSDPTAIPDDEALDKSIPVAQLAGLRVTLAVYPYPPHQIEDGTARPASFAAWLRLLANRYPTVKQYVVMNEPNQPAFLRPQFDARGVNVSAAKAGRFLAAGYDALKEVDPEIKVIGLGLSPRGNDRPTAVSNVSTSPVRFLNALGLWYRHSGRTKPLMDGLSFHPYPSKATDPPEKRYRWPNAGFADLNRIKQAVWDAFRGTAQPTTANGLKIYLDEVGWQVDTSGLAGYTGVENVEVTDPRTQARVYSRLIHMAACDGQIAEVNFFGFYDDRPRGSGFQAALNEVDGTPRPSAGAVQAAIAQSSGGCSNARVVWHPATRVIGALRPEWQLRPDRTVVHFEAAADEGAWVVACLLPGWLGNVAAEKALTAKTPKSPGCTGGEALPARPVRIRLERPSPLRPVTVAVRLVAEGSDRRVSTFSRIYS